MVVPTSAQAPTEARTCRRTRPRRGGGRLIQRQLGHTDLGTTSTYLQGIDPSEIIDAVRARRQPNELRHRRADPLTADHNDPPPAAPAGGPVGSLGRTAARQPAHSPDFCLRSAAARSGSAGDQTRLGDRAAVTGSGLRFIRAMRFRRLLEPVRRRRVVALRLRVNTDPCADRAALLSVVRCDSAASWLRLARYSEGPGSLTASPRAPRTS